MNDSNKQKPAGYGHDQKGTAGGAAKNEGRVHVTHSGPMQRVADRGGKPTAETFFIDDREIDIRPDETIFRAARRLDIKLPHLCYTPKPGYRADGNCRVCMVEVEGERVLAASCIRTPSPGMKVKTQTDRAKTARKMVAELLLTDQPAIEVAHDPDSELWKIVKRLKIEAGRFPKREPIKVPAPDRSHVAMAVNLDACIQCNLCVRACREVQVNDVIGMAGRGHLEKIVFDIDDPMGASTCVACGECVQACPTGALAPAHDAYLVPVDKTVASVCPYCGVGCQLTYHVADNRIVRVEGRDGVANRERLCVKGRIGSGAVSNPVMDVMLADVILLIGANPVVNHPVAATWMKNAVKRGTKLILIDPRRSELARHATHYLQFKPDTDVALLNAIMHTIIEEGWVQESFVAERTNGFEALKANVANYSPEAMAPICGVPAPLIREVARLYATSRGSMILWGMGISQHVHGTDNARCLIALCLMTGQVGRPGTGLHPLRGQNNVQGASDSGLIPMVFPDYQRVDNASARAKFEALWGATLDPVPGLTVVEIMDAVHAG